MPHSVFLQTRQWWFCLRTSSRVTDQRTSQVRLVQPKVFPSPQLEAHPLRWAYASGLDRQLHKDLSFWTCFKIDLGPYHIDSIPSQTALSAKLYCRKLPGGAEARGEEDGSALGCSWTTALDACTLTREVLNSYVACTTLSAYCNDICKHISELIARSCKSKLV